MQTKSTKICYDNIGDEYAFNCYDGTVKNSWNIYKFKKFKKTKGIQKGLLC